MSQTGVSLSGGVHRAALFGLGVLGYMMDAGRNRHVVAIASGSEWGSGWPDCNRLRWIPLSVLSVKGRVVRRPSHRVRSEEGNLAFEEVEFPSSVREAIHRLVSPLLQVSQRRGLISLRPGWCWDGGCRPIARSDGTVIASQSNHSCGLALDIGIRR